MNPPNSPHKIISDAIRHTLTSKAEFVAADVIARLEQAGYMIVQARASGLTRGTCSACKGAAERGETGSWWHLEDPQQCAGLDTIPEFIPATPITDATDNPPPCTCLHMPHAVNCRYRFWKLTRGQQP